MSHHLSRLLNFTSERHTSWKNPEASIGDFCRTMGRNMCWHARGPARDIYIQLAEEVKTYIDRNCEPPSRDLYWSLYMIGRSECTARPVLMFICEDGDSRKIARKAIKESGILLKYPGVDTADCSRPPDFEQLVQLASGEYKDDSVMQQTDSETSVFYSPTNFILGSHVFTKESVQVGEMSMGATAGVIVKLGDDICILTAAHGFASRTAPADPGPPFEYDIDGESDSDDEEFLQTIRQGSRSPPSQNSDFGLEESENSMLKSGSSQESELSTGETMTGRATTDPPATVESTSTRHVSFQETLDDSTHHHRRHYLSDNRSPSPSRASTLPRVDLSTAALEGAVLLPRAASQNDKASLPRHPILSRISQRLRIEYNFRRKWRRDIPIPEPDQESADAMGPSERAGSKSRSRSKSSTRRNSVTSANARPLESGIILACSVEGSNPSLDYALIKIKGWYAGKPKSHRYKRRFSYKSRSPLLMLMLNVTQVSDSRPKDAKIFAITGSSGYLNGRLLGTSSFLRAPDQPSQELWTVKLDGKLEGGDSGTCVFDAQTGDLYGHVVAGNPDSGYAYIIPAYQVRNDLLKRFGEDLQFLKPAMHDLRRRLLISTNRSQSKESLLPLRPRPLDDVSKPISDKIRRERALDSRLSTGTP